MKIVVQNGVKHGLTRREAEAMIPLFPPAWGKAIRSITLFAGNGPDVDVSFHRQTQAFGLHWPVAGPAPTKLEAVETLLISLAVVADTGDHPKRLNSSTRAAYASSIRELLETCKKLVSSSIEGT